LPDRVAHLIPPDGLWSHQAAAIDAVREFQDVVIATPTASGKSLCYQIPIAEAVTATRPATALVLFPTKALAHDQVRGFATTGLPEMLAATYDGDAAPEERTWARSGARVVLSNPEMIHYGLLPNHRRWATFLGRLSHIVIDEMHVARGVFGSHLGHVLRRLLRLAHHYGADPTFVFTSATIGEPALLASSLCGRPVQAILDSGAPLPARQVVLWNPNPDPTAPLQRSVMGEAAAVAAALVAEGRRTLVFCESRRATEQLALRLRQLVPDGDRRVRAYRSGLLAEERREIESALADGTLHCVTTTSALELGVDIAGLDATVLCGVPGTVASLWQRVGRSGRRDRAALSVVIAGDDQLDQWTLRHPRAALSRPVERAVVNVSNPYVLHPHLGCAAHERALSPVDERYWPELLDDGVRDLVRDDQLRILQRRGQPAAVWAPTSWPSSAISLRAAAGAPYDFVTDSGEVVGTLDAARLDQQAHPRAIYLHQGVAWEVEALDTVRRQVLVRPSDGTLLTRARSTSALTIVETHDDVAITGARQHLGVVEVEHRVTGFEVIRSADRKVIERVPLELEPRRFRTTSLWWHFSAATMIDVIDPAGALHALEHAAIGMLPLFAICDRWDVGGLSTTAEHTTGEPTVFIHDAVPGGCGIAALAFEQAGALLAATRQLVADCSCERGCPGCVQSPKCGNGNEPLDKAGASLMLDRLVSDPPAMDRVPPGNLVSDPPAVLAVTPPAP
jgi:DEAD/DEAH box helicase domain-containing protein